uniref:Uncharacterized protein n=1 Tax=Arundo donax TaxID=35708 RepID=A0A0A9A9G8_ARUDO
MAMTLVSRRMPSTTSSSIVVECTLIMSGSCSGRCATTCSARRRGHREMRSTMLLKWHPETDSLSSTGNSPPVASGYLNTCSRSSLIDFARWKPGTSTAGPYTLAEKMNFTGARRAAVRSSETTAASVQ